MKIMGILNLTPDSFFGPSRSTVADALARINEMISDGADIIDIGAVSTRPGAADVVSEEEWRRLEPVLSTLPEGMPISIDTTSSEIVRKVYAIIGKFTVNDISAGEDDASMLATVAELGLPYIAMHKRGNPRTMDYECVYDGGVVEALLDYFEAFELKAAAYGIEDWILDPGLGFAKTAAQNWEILAHLEAFKALGRPILIGAADKRFTGGDTEKAHRMAMLHGADILRVHDVRQAVLTVGLA